MMIGSFFPALNGNADDKEYIIMKRKADELLPDLRNFFWPRPTIKGILGCIVLILALFAMMYAISSTGGPSTGFRPLSMTERIFCASIFPAGCLFYALIYFVRSRLLMKSIEKRWPTKEEKERLNKNFAEAATVFRGNVKIGKEYTFLRMEQKIVETGLIRSFHTETRSYARGSATYIIATVRDPEEEYEREIDVLILGANKKGKEEADDLIHEAISVLRFMLPEKSDDE